MNLTEEENILLLDTCIMDELDLTLGRITGLDRQKGRIHTSSTNYKLTILLRASYATTHGVGNLLQYTNIITGSLQHCTQMMVYKNRSLYNYGKVSMRNMLLP